MQERRIVIVTSPTIQEVHSSATVLLLREKDAKIRGDINKEETAGGDITVLTVLVVNINKLPDE